ncbi:hypothetical protein PIB30_054618 [Stylosanthes scabra]|uniref:Aminotransferase-like plant mobile domain-containing protein n=1 Tax=Stylosanthes scabra TaxID=79078 RepID=A0ABU6SIT2_9FABA|nr:hypothetical protein [Stylosanthes scabra]
MAADRGTTDIAGCVPLIMSWIYQRFPTFCPEARDVIVFPLVSRLTGYRQMNRDSHERRMVQIRSQLDRLGVHELTWRAAVPIVCFMFVRMHHVDRVKRQLGGEQQIPEDLVNLDGLLTISNRGEDQHWPTRHAQWYHDWRGRFAPERQVTITPTQNPAMPTREYFDWWEVACTSRFLSPADALDDPCLDGLPDDVFATATQQRDKLASPVDVPLTGRRRQRFRPDIKRQARGGWGRGADGEPQRPVGAIDSEEEAEYDQQEEGGVGTSGHGGEAGTQQTYDTGGEPIIGEDIPVDDAFFDGAEHDFQASFGGPGTSASAEP